MIEIDGKTPWHMRSGILQDTSKNYTAMKPCYVATSIFYDG